MCLERFTVQFIQENDLWWTRMQVLCPVVFMPDKQDAHLWHVQKVQAMANKSPPETPLPVAFASCRELSAIATAISAAKVAQATVARPWRSEGSSMANAHGSTQQYLSSLRGGWVTSLQILPKALQHSRKKIAATTLRFVSVFSNLRDHTVWLGPSHSAQQVSHSWTGLLRLLRSLNINWETK